MVFRWLKHTWEAKGGRVLDLRSQPDGRLERGKLTPEPRDRMVGKQLVVPHVLRVEIARPLALVLRPYEQSRFPYSRDPSLVALHLDHVANSAKGNVSEPR